MMSVYNSHLREHSQHQQECIAKISHLSATLKHISQNYIGTHEVEIITNALQELEDVCHQLLLVWNNFCIIPLLYLIEPVFRALRVMIVLPIPSVAISCSHFLSFMINIRVKVYSSITAERVFSSIFDCSTVNLLIINFRTAFEQNVQSQLIAVSSTVGLLSDLLRVGAAELYMSSSLISLLFDLYMTVLHKFNFEDDHLAVFGLKCSSAFPTVLKLRSKADIVLSRFQLTAIFSEEHVNDLQFRHVRIQAWAALGIEISPFLRKTFSECWVSDSDQSNIKLCSTASDVLLRVCRNPQLVCSSKLFERTSSAIRCVRLVIDALNRWRHHLVTGSALSEVNRLKAIWFVSESSFVILLLLYCFDFNDVIRNEAISTLKEVGKFYAPLFSEHENAQLMFDALSAILKFCRCTRVISDINWLRDLCSCDKDCRVLPRCPFISTVSVPWHARLPLFAIICSHARIFFAKLFRLT